MKKNIVVKSNKLVTAIQNLSLFEARLIQLAIVDARESGKGLHVDKPLRIDAFRYAEVFGLLAKTLISNSKKPKKHYSIADLPLSTPKIICQ